MPEIQSRTKPVPVKRVPISETRFRDRVARMGVVKRPTTTSAAMEGLRATGAVPVSRHRMAGRARGT